MPNRHCHVKILWQKEANNRLIFPSLLDHLNYAIHIIHQGKSCLSNLLTKAAAVLSLHNRVTLDDTRKMEMGLRQHFLSSWTVIFFFYDYHHSTWRHPNLQWHSSVYWFQRLLRREMVHLRLPLRVQISQLRLPLSFICTPWAVPHRHSHQSLKSILILVVEIRNKGRPRSSAITISSFFSNYVLTN